MTEVRVLEALRANGLDARAVHVGQWPASATASGSVDNEVIAVVDLTATDALEAITAAVDAGIPVIAFGPHVDGASFAAARAAGALAVYPRGRFVQQAAALVRAAVAPQSP
jgi:hypothetical protein